MQRVQHVSVREAVRFLVVSGGCALPCGVAAVRRRAWLNAVPSLPPFREWIHLWGACGMRLLVQRRLGLSLELGLPLALTAVAAAGAVSWHEREFDVLGDLATNDGKARHTRGRAPRLAAHSLNVRTRLGLLYGCLSLDASVLAAWAGLAGGLECCIGVGGLGCVLVSLCPHAAVIRLRVVQKKLGVVLVSDKWRHVPVQVWMGCAEAAEIRSTM